MKISIEKYGEYGIISAVMDFLEAGMQKIKIAKIAVLCTFQCCISAFAEEPGATPESPYAKPGLNIVVESDSVLTVTNAEVQVDVAAGATAEFLGVDKDVFVRAQSGATVVVKGPSASETSWHAKVGLWLDASEEWTLEQEVSIGGYRSTVTENGKTSAAIVRWRDRRPEQTEWLGYNDRGKKMANGTYPGVMPYVVSNGCNNLTYVTMGNQVLYGRRMPFIKVVDGVEMSPGHGGANDSYVMDVKYVMMVFGSQRGGGYAVVSGMCRANTDGVVAADAGIFNGRYETRLDGTGVDPVTTGFNGGWQVLSFVPSATNVVRGLGWGSWNTNQNGGQNYAEVLIFTNRPSLYEIRSAELYLANKWGVSDYSLDESGEVRLFGDGSASVAGGSVRVGGAFSGELAVSNGATAVFSDEYPIPAAPAAGMHGWYDPGVNLETEEIAAGEKYVLRAMSMQNIANPYNGKAYDLNGYSRGPHVSSDVRGWGTQAMTWFDYGTNRLGGACNGTTMRFDGAVDGVEHCLPVRTGFMMLDTRAGGGTPFLDTSIYSFLTSVTSQYVLARVDASPIFRVKDNSSFVTNSLVCLNGVSVNPGVHKYNARPELLSFMFDRDMPIRCIGAFQQNSGYTSDPFFELRHGELIFYPTELSGSDRKITEAYLMSKWLGITPKGFGAPSDMTVTGEGTVKAANGKLRPGLSSGFTGTFEIADPVLTFALGPSQYRPVADMISLPSGKLVTPGAVTVNVSLEAEPEPGRYILIDAKEWNDAEVRLGSVSGAGAGRLVCNIVKDGNVLALNVRRYGMRVIVR